MTIDHPTREIAARYLQLAEEMPDRDALVYARPPFTSTHLTWADIAQKSEDTMTAMTSVGVRAGSRCAITLADHPDVVPTLLALWRLDATAVLVDVNWGRGLTQNVINHSGADFALDVVGENPVCIGSRDYPHDLPEGTAMLGYTSGSTGDPKGIPFTHSKLALTMHASAAAATARRGTAPTRLACSARLSGSGTLNMHYVWAAFADASVVVLPELSIGTARDYWQRIDDFGVDQTYLVPALVEILLRMAKPRSEDSAAPLCLSGSAPVTERAQRRHHERFGLPLFNCYGISEAMCAIFFGHRNENGRATNDVGIPWLLQARLIDSAGSPVVGVGEGELQLSGPTMLDRYYGNPAATEAAFDGRWFRTGDIMRRDARGIYRIAGRSKDVVMKGGFAIYLNEVEEAALSVAGVAEAAATPLLDDTGEDIGLITRFAHDADTTVSDVAAVLRDQLGAQRAPARVVTVAQALPRTGQDKIDRRAVASLWQSVISAEEKVAGV